jgi:hypothetical protein
MQAQLEIVKRLFLHLSASSSASPSSLTEQSNDNSNTISQQSFNENEDSTL